MTAASRLSEWMRQAKATMDSVGALNGVTGTHIAHILAGRRRPSLSLAFRLQRMTHGAVRAEDWCTEDELCLPPRRPDGDTEASAA